MIELLPSALMIISKRMIRSAKDLMAGIALQQLVDGRQSLRTDDRVDDRRLSERALKAELG
jgi:hypothetical protein